MRLLEGKAAALLTRGSYSQYVSANVAKSDKVVSPKAAKGRERRWRLFSTFPILNADSLVSGIDRIIRKTWFYP
jgi:hypothetical protein